MKKRILGMTNLVISAGGGDESLPMTEGSPSGHAQDSATAQGIEEEEVKKEKQQAVEKEVAKRGTIAV